MEQPVLLAVPNVSEGRREVGIAAIAAAFAGDDAAARSTQGADEGRGGRVRLLDVHSDADHHRSVFSLAGPPRALADRLLAGAAVVVASVDVMARAGSGSEQTGQHPRVGALDVVPIVYLREDARGAACAEALLVADRIGDELGVPVFLYGELSAEEPASVRTRAELRRGGIRGLELAMAASGAVEPLVPDFGPRRMHPSAGATLVAARPPLVAFNVTLAPPAGIADARAIAAHVREGGEGGLPGVRAIGVELAGGVAQVSTNVERPLTVALAEVVAAIAAQAPVAAAELVGLAPAAALEGFPRDLPMPGFDPGRQIIENALGSL